MSLIIVLFIASPFAFPTTSTFGWGGHVTTGNIFDMFETILQTRHLQHTQNANQFQANQHRYLFFELVIIQLKLSDVTGQLLDLEQDITFNTQLFLHDRLACQHTFLTLLYVEVLRS